MFSTNLSLTSSLLFMIQDGLTALMLASGNGRTEVVRLLLEDGRADVNHKNKVSYH